MNTRMRLSRVPLCLLAATLCLLIGSTRVWADYIGGEPYCFCITKTCPKCQKSGPVTPSDIPTSANPNVSDGISLSLTRGNLHQIQQSIFGRTSPFSLSYNSYMADGNKAQLDAGVGLGWTHSLNAFLFSQRGHIFRSDENGGITHYLPTSNPTVFRPTTSWFETLTANPGGTYTITLKDRTRYTFGPIAGDPLLVGGPVLRLLSIVYRNGDTTTLSYSGGLLTQVADTYGRITKFLYNPQKRLASVTDPLGRKTTFTYDATGRQLTKLTDPAGKSIQYSYNTLNQMTRMTDRDGRYFTFQYSAQRVPVAILDSSGNTVASATNTSNWATDRTVLARDMNRVYVPSTTTVKDGRGNIWKYDYDANGYITKKTAPDGSETRYTYDPGTLHVATVQDANGHTSAYTYDAQGNILQQTNDLGHTTTFTYEPTYNQMTSMTDANGRTTTYTIDPANGNKTKETDPLGNHRDWTYDAHGNILSSKDKRGSLTTYTYDSFGNRTKIIDPLPPAGSSVTTMTYDTVGNMLTKTDSNGHQTKYAYDSLDRRTKATDPLNFVTTMTYNNEGHLTKITDPNGHSTTMTYDTRLRLQTKTDALGKTTSYVYDANDNRTSMTDRNGHTTTYTYDTQNRQTKTTDALNQTTATTYDAAGNVLSTIDGRGLTTQYHYDALNRVIDRIDPVPAPNTTRYDYDMTGLSGAPECTGPTRGSNQITQLTDSNGHVTYYGYDGLDRVTRQVQKVGPTTFGIADPDALMTMTYDPDNNRLSTAVRTVAGTDLTTTYTYDPMNRRTQETNPAGETTLSQYDNVGNVIKVTTPNGNVTTSVYDANDRLTTVTDSVGPVVKYTYDGVDNRLTVTDGNNHTTTTAYDPVNRPVTVTDPLGKSTLTTYDPEGNVTKVTDRNGHITTYSYDDVNRKVKMTDALGNQIGMGHITLYGYDPVGNRVQITDPNGNSTLYTYDGLNRRTTETYSDAGVLTNTYDAVGNRLTRTDQNGRLTQYQYDDLNRLTKRTGPSAVDTYTYDLAGRKLTASRNGWADTFIYDGANRVTYTTQGGQIVQYTYDIPGRTRTVTYPGGRVVTEHTDPRARIDTIGDAASMTPITQYVYDLANNVTGRGARNGVVALSTYDADDHVLTLDHTIGMQRVVGFTYGYDNEGNRLYEGRLHNPSHAEAYSYDALDRLIDYRVGPPMGMATSQTVYDLDPVGNWNQKVKNGVTENRAHNAVNEITAIQINAGPITSLTYDLNGNMLSDSNFSYVYDEENRITHVDNITGMIPVPVADYQYDALGRRVKKKTYPGIPTETHYLYDDTRVIEEQDAASDTQATYVYGNYVDEVLTMDRGGQTYYYHQNALYSPHALTNAAGLTVEGYEYDAYGRQTLFAPGLNGVVDFGGDDSVTIGGSSLLDNPYLYTGRELDSETGLYYYRARQYDPIKGRFLQRDPIGYEDGLNLYEYVKSNPLRYTDPYGRWTWKGVACRATCWGLGGAVCAAVACFCVAGSVITVGGLAVPCTAVIIGTCALAAAGSSVCNDICPP